ncbi:expressed unknown protein [Seminavis robusta]|uniref:Uncharacterized protein n=1 Tax=Seminavis robusta TaxID=568900 RepID=A0A9N8DVT9_9STRA|nr:expressed unknown protein [Seminavis robusta]|eukprot:Sro319_g116360.1 n/a (245) ;mRNA; f:70343-71077
MPSQKYSDDYATLYAHAIKNPVRAHSHDFFLRLANRETKQVVLEGFYSIQKSRKKRNVVFIDLKDHPIEYEPIRQSIETSKLTITILSYLAEGPRLVHCSKMLQSSYVDVGIVGPHWRSCFQEILPYQRLWDIYNQFIYCTLYARVDEESCSLKLQQLRIDFGIRDHRSTGPYGESDEYNESDASGDHWDWQRTEEEQEFTSLQNTLDQNAERQRHRRDEAARNRHKPRRPFRQTRWRTTARKR